VSGQAVCPPDCKTGCCATDGTPEDLLIRDALRNSDLEFSVFADARAIIKGTKDSAAARAAYAKYVGG
jgi:hypothetical protein